MKNTASALATVFLFSLSLVAQMTGAPQRPAPASAEDQALVAEFTKLEHDWMMALQQKDFARLETFLAPQYALFISEDASRRVPRAIWLRNSTAYNLSWFEQRNLQMQRITDDTVSVSFIHSQKAMPQPPGQPARDRSGDFYIVDVWTKVNGAWKVAARYSSPPPQQAAASAPQASTPSQAAPATPPAPPVDEDVRAGRKLNNEGKQDEAIALYRKVLAAKPDSYDAHISLGVALDLKGEYAEARKHLQRAIELAPAAARAQALRTMAMSYAFESKSKEAEKYHQQVFDERTSANDHAGAAEIANEIARVCLESGDVAAAQSWYQAGFNSASRATGMKETEKALWLFRWEHAQARIAARRNQKADAMKHAAAARAALDKALADPENKEQETYYPYLLGYIAFHTGDWKEAIAQLGKSNQKDPFILVLLAQAHEKQGDSAKARDYYQQVLKFNNHNPTNAFARPIAKKKLGM